MVGHSASRGTWHVMFQCQVTPIPLHKPSLLLTEADMNLPSNLEFYRQILELENDPSRHELNFSDLLHPQQRSLQALAHSRKLEYEYHSGRARVFRKYTPPTLNASGPSNSTNLSSGSGGGSSTSSLIEDSSQSIPIPHASISPSLPSIVPYHVPRGHSTMAADHNAFDFGSSSTIPEAPTWPESVFDDFSGFQNNARSMTQHSHQWLRHCNHPASTHP